MNRLFVARQQQHAESMMSFIRLNWRQMAEAGAPLAARFTIYKKDRSTEQNSLMWVWLTHLAEHAWTAGRQYSAETWHEHLKRELLPEVNAKGMEKWRHLPSGERDLQMGTSHLNAGEMAEYLDRLQAWAAVELGVELHVMAAER